MFASKSVGHRPAEAIASRRIDRLLRRYGVAVDADYACLAACSHRTGMRASMASLLANALVPNVDRQFESRIRIQRHIQGHQLLG